MKHSKMLENHDAFETMVETLLDSDPGHVVIIDARDEDGDTRAHLVLFFVGATLTREAAERLRDSVQGIVIAMPRDVNVDPETLS